MSVHISFRNVDYCPSSTGVRIRVYTDVACHIFCRVTAQQPWIHKKASLRRGIQFAEDVRFCFTVFKDNEQFEPGDTTTHTFWKTNWPPCTTKWFYFWGYVSGVLSPSTSPLFKYHNTGEAPVPPPDIMYQLNAIDPQFYTFSGGVPWFRMDVSRDIPEGATGVLWHLRNTNVGAEESFGLKKPGANYTTSQPFQRDGTLWAIVGLNEAREFEYHTSTPGQIEGYLMGYTGRDVVFPDDPIDIKPAVSNVWDTFDIGATWPEAILILTDLGSSQVWNCFHSIVPAGSAKFLSDGSYRCFPFCGIPGDGRIHTYLRDRDGGSTQWLAYAYFKKDTSFSLDGIDYVGFTANAWKDLLCSAIGPECRFAFIEYTHPFIAEHVSARKNHSYFNLAGRNNNHGWMITHVHHDFNCQVWSGAAGAADQLLGIAETH